MGETLETGIEVGENLKRDWGEDGEKLGRSRGETFKTLGRGWGLAVEVN